MPTNDDDDAGAALREFARAMLDASAESQARVLVRMLERESECAGVLSFAKRVCDALATEEEAACELADSFALAPRSQMTQ